MENLIQMLVDERDKLDQAIRVLRGPVELPIANMLSVYDSSIGEAPKPAEPHRHRTVSKRKFSAAQRAKQSERMKVYWASRRKAKK